MPQQAIVERGYRGVDADNPGLEIIQRGKYKSLRKLHMHLLKLRQVIEARLGLEAIFLRLPGSDRVCGSLAAGDLGMATVSW